MRVAQGGTRMYCPHCKKDTVCASRPLSAFRDYGTGQHWEHKQHRDLQWFRRGRICLTCHLEFVTAEVSEAFIDELVELRDALAAIKTSVTTFSTQSKLTTKALKSLDDTLTTLKALRVYDEQSSDANEA